MNLAETLSLVSKKETANGLLLEQALSLRRYRHRSSCEILQASDAFYLPAVNAKARIKWTTACLREMYEHFDIGKDDEGLEGQGPIFLVTIADKSHVTNAQAKNINFQAIRRKLSGAMRMLSYIGMIEPGYFNVIYDENCRTIKDRVSWHGHFLVWGTNRRKLNRWRRKIETRIGRVIQHRCAIHIKRVSLDQFGHRLWYINKSPCTEYSIGKRREPTEDGSPRYKQNSRPLRPGHRVRLFQMLRDVTLPELAMAGGGGREILRRTKYVALEDHRQKNQRRRPRS